MSLPTPRTFHSRRSTAKGSKSNPMHFWLAVVNRHVIGIVPRGRRSLDYWFFLGIVLFRLEDPPASACNTGFFTRSDWLHPLQRGASLQLLHDWHFSFRVAVLSTVYACTYWLSQTTRGTHTHTDIHIHVEFTNDIAIRVVFNPSVPISTWRKTLQIKCHWCFYTPRNALCKNIRTPRGWIILISNAVNRVWYAVSLAGAVWVVETTMKTVSGPRRSQWAALAWYCKQGVDHKPLISNYAEYANYPNCYDALVSAMSSCKVIDCSGPRR